MSAFKPHAPIRPALFLLAVAALWVASPAARGQSPANPITSVQKSEAQVRAMPLDQRPNRLGHFYGNNVRRLKYGRLCVNCGQTERPLARYLYVTRR